MKAEEEARRAPAPTPEWQAEGQAAVAAAGAPGFCSSCGNALAMGATFCGNCGAAVAAGAAAGMQYAGFWMRFAAAFIDGIILIVVQVVLSLVIDDSAGLFVLNILVGLVYTVGFWVAADGATPGKMAMGVKVVEANGDPLDPGRAVGRYLAYFLSAITLGIGYLMIAFTAEKRGLHDYVAGTVVIKTR